MSEYYDLKHQKRRDAFGLFYESVLKPDHELRQCLTTKNVFTN